MEPSRAAKQLVLLLAASQIQASAGFVHRHGFSTPRYLGSLAAVQVNPKANQGTLVSEGKKNSASQLDELLQKTARDVNVLQEISGPIEIICEADEDTTSTSSNASQDDTEDEDHASPPANERAQEKDDEVATERRKLAARAALLGSRAQKGRSSGSSSRSNTRTTTSVGARRVGSASKAREGPGVTKRIMDAARKSASSNRPKDGNDNSQGRDATTSYSPASSMPLSRTLTPSGIHSAVFELMERQRKNSGSDATGNLDNSLKWNQQPQLLHPPGDLPFSRKPPPGSVLIPSTMDSPSGRDLKLQFPDCLTIRVAQGLPVQDTEVAHLRLSVFSDFSPEVRRQLVPRSVNAVVTRRMKGATCLVATVPPSIAARKRNRPPVILGSAECSFHEFEGTTLGRRRPTESILYITEVAVSPNARRRGIGRKLLEAIDVLAEMRRIETLYLHVDVENQSALALYEKAGYQRVDKSEPMFLEFTTKLNLHDGATKGRNHFLLYKDMVKCPTWLAEPVVADEHPPVMARKFEQTNAGTLGFEVPCQPRL